MELNRTENDVLKLLAAEWDQAGPPGYIETTAIAARLEVSVHQVKAAIQSLFEKGVVDTDNVDTFAAYLTPEGYELARKC
jgi:Mn-dependent DtxR family transcriptional regulator